MIENFNFIRTIVEDLLTKRAIVYTIDNNNIGARSIFNGPFILDDDELKDIKKTKSLGKAFESFGVKLFNCLSST